MDVRPAGPIGGRKQQMKCLDDGIITGDLKKQMKLMNLCLL